MLSIKMYQLLIFLIVFVVVEFIGMFIFTYIRNKYYTSTSAKKNNQSIIKGILERLLMYVGLVSNASSVLVLFGALKLNTRLKVDSEEEKISNEYFLIGNTISVLFAFLQFHLYQFLIVYIYV